MCVPAVQAAPITYCVNDSGCVANGGTAQGSIEAAVTAANANPGVDRIFVGESTTPYVLAAAVTLADVRIYGAGIGRTVIQGPAGNLFDLTTGESRLSRLSVVGDGGSLNTVVAVTGSSAPTDVSLDTVRVENASTTGGNAVGISASTTISAATIVSGTDAPNATGLLSGSGATVTVQDSTIRGEYGVYQAGGSLTLRRTRIDFRRYGVYGYVVPSVTSTATLRASSLLLAGVPGMATNATGVYARSNGFNADSELLVTLRNVTAIHPSTPGAGTRIGWVDTINGTHNQHVSFNVDGMSIAGPWSYRYTVGAPVANAAIDGSVLDQNTFPGLTDLIAGGTVIYPDGEGTTVDPRFVDMAGGDYHLRWDSPLLDAGSTVASDSWEELGDLDRRSRTVNRTGSGTAARDIGAYEYVRQAPRIVAAPPSGTVAPGAPLAYAVSGVDDNAGETASLTYSWTLPDGSARSGSSVTFAAPTAPGAYALTVTVTDVSGLAASAQARIVVPAAGDPPAPAPPLLADLVPPKVRVTPARTTLAKLLARTALTANVAPNEAVSAKLSLTATITTPPSKRGGRPKVATVVVATSTLGLANGVRTVKLVPTKAAIARVGAARSARGAKLVWTVVGTATDAAGNRTSVAAKVVAR